MTNLNNLTPEQLEIIQEWRDCGAAAACRDLDEVMHFLIQPIREPEPYDTLRMLQNLLAIHHELSAFIPGEQKKGGES